VVWWGGVGGLFFFFFFFLSVSRQRIVTLFPILTVAPRMCTCVHRESSEVSICTQHEDESRAKKESI